MIAAERFDLIDAVHMTPISTSINPQMRTSASLPGRFVIARLQRLFHAVLEVLQHHLPPVLTLSRIAIAM